MIQARRDPRTGVYVVTDAHAREIVPHTEPRRPVPPAPTRPRPVARYSPKAGPAPALTYRVRSAPLAQRRSHLARHWRRYTIAGVVVAGLGLLAWLAYLVVTAVAATAAAAAAFGPAVLGGLLLLGLLAAVAGRGGSCHTTVTVHHRHR
jgi:hypothetical protein